MEAKLFHQLLESAQEMVDIQVGRKKSARTTRYRPLDPKGIRERSGLTQERFAALLGVTVATYCSWEQGHPVGGPAKTLLMVEDYSPGIICSAIRAQRTGDNDHV